MSQIISLESLFQLRSSIHFKDKTIVLVTGVFDLLHQEHKNFLTKAKQVGDILLLGLETDSRARQLKGKGRPVNLFQKRLKNLAAWDIADYIFALPENFANSKTRESFTLKLHPHILAVSQHTPYFGEKQRIMKLVGGRVLIVHPHNPLISTTKLLDKLKK